MKPEEESLAIGPELVEELPVEPQPGRPSPGQVWRSGAWQGQEPASSKQARLATNKNFGFNGPPDMGNALAARSCENSCESRSKPQIVALSVCMGLGPRDIASDVSMPVIYCRGA